MYQEVAIFLLLGYNISRIIQITLGENTKVIDFIINPNSGKGKGKKALGKISRYCRKNSIGFAVHLTDAPGHASKIASEICGRGADTVVAVGGDGTFHEVLNGIPDFEKVRLGFIPAGRGNDYARAAGLHLNTIKALKDVLHGKEVRSDYIAVGDKRCLNIAGTGLDTEVLKRVMGKSGKITYLKSLIYCVHHFKPYDISLKVGDEEVREDVIMIGVCNGIAIGGGMKLSPRSEVNDNKMEVISVRMPKNGKIMKALFGFVKGKHIDKEYTTCRSCDEVTIRPALPQTVQIDGELYDGLEFDCRLVKNGIRTFETSGKK